MSKPSSDSTAPLTYRDSGVDIDAGNALVERIKSRVKATSRAGVLTGIGGFGGLFELPWKDYDNPVLVSGTDGVGTKLKLAIELGIHDTIGIDLVAMCVNDIVVTGAEPLFFLDYFATGQLKLDHAEAVISGIADGCQQAGCALIGGETAEMPGMYAEDDYDLAGFAVGLVEKTQIIDAAQVEVGDAVIGIQSSGAHSNGYSLIRKVIELAGDHADLSAPFDYAPDGASRTLGEALLMPTRIYVKPLLALIPQFDLHAIAHITGGGLTENLPRVLPEDTAAIINTNSWTRPKVFDWLQNQAHIEDTEMLRTLNCGIGMTICLPADQVDAAIAQLNQAGEHAMQIGEIIAHQGAPVVQYA